MLTSKTNFQTRHPKLPNWAIPTVYAFVAVAVGMIVPRWEPVLLPRIHVSMSTTAAVAIFTSVVTGMPVTDGYCFFTFVRHGAVQRNRVLAAFGFVDRARSGDLARSWSLCGRSYLCNQEAAILGPSGAVRTSQDPGVLLKDMELHAILLDILSLQSSSDDLLTSLGRQTARKRNVVVIYPRVSEVVIGRKRDWQYLQMQTRRPCAQSDRSENLVPKVVRVTPRVVL